MCAGPAGAVAPAPSCPVGHRAGRCRPFLPSAVPHSGSPGPRARGFRPVSLFRRPGLPWGCAPPQPPPRPRRPVPLCLAKKARGRPGGEGVSRRRGHCPKRGKGERGGGGAGGPGRLGRGSGCGDGALELERSTWARAPRPPFPPLAGAGSLGLPVAAARGGSGAAGGERGAGADVPPAPTPAPGLAALRPEKFFPEFGAPRTSRPLPVPRPTRPALGVYGGLLCEGSPTWGYWASIVTFPRLQTDVHWEQAPDSSSPYLASLIPAPQAPSPSFLGPFIRNSDRSGTPILRTSGDLPPPPTEPLSPRDWHVAPTSCSLPPL